uniref:Uncharacterized protein n=2 Tax=Chromera velia CCMP2878 TaxID=1169474 RepID=A0A0G4F1Y1_9ALVE|eukprot:Cvel_14575.t1-p1 / transcript=Cvel_14575.t1 / gene=Cvel_14575 / organism=Chromera_velia_CCMP2878 / gene_product=hypothetical protein / transcript_product=hypothetical protein / location=Cvel_scaffold1042:4432-8160(-) / protein_length=709 / sequence_SO=supercontig / SO=protein_coding / is_pseudo=false
MATWLCACLFACLVFFDGVRAQEDQIATLLSSLSAAVEESQANKQEEKEQPPELIANKDAETLANFLETHAQFPKMSKLPNVDDILNFGVSPQVANEEVEPETSPESLRSSFLEKFGGQASSSASVLPQDDEEEMGDGGQEQEEAAEGAQAGQGTAGFGWPQFSQAVAAMYAQPQFEGMTPFVAHWKNPQNTNEGGAGKLAETGEGLRPPFSALSLGEGDRNREAETEGDKSFFSSMPTSQSTSVTLQVGPSNQLDALILVCGLLRAFAVPCKPVAFSTVAHRVITIQAPHPETGKFMFVSPDLSAPHLTDTPSPLLLAHLLPLMHRIHELRQHVIAHRLLSDAIHSHHHFSSHSSRSGKGHPKHRFRYRITHTHTHSVTTTTTTTTTTVKMPLSMAMPFWAVPPRRVIMAQPVEHTPLTALVAKLREYKKEQAKKRLLMLLRAIALAKARKQAEMSDHSIVHRHVQKSADSEMMPRVVVINAPTFAPPPMPVHTEQPVVHVAEQQQAKKPDPKRLAVLAAFLRGLQSIQSPRLKISIHLHKNKDGKTIAQPAAQQQGEYHSLGQGDLLQPITEEEPTSPKTPQTEGGEKDEAPTKESGGGAAPEVASGGTGNKNSEDGQSEDQEDLRPFFSPLYDRTTTVDSDRDASPPSPVFAQGQGDSEGERDQPADKLTKVPLPIQSQDQTNANSFSGNEPEFLNLADLLTGQGI